MNETAEKQIALCSLILRGDHWLPMPVDGDLAASERSSPDGPIIRAIAVAVTEGQKIVHWQRLDFEVREVAPDGSIVDPDPELALAAATLGAAHEDAKARHAGAVGINELLANRRREQEEQRVPDDLRRSALDRARSQILDRLHGRKTVGVTLVRAST